MLEKSALELLDFIKLSFDKGTGHIPLHQTIFQIKEQEYVKQCLDSGIVSTVGEFVLRLETNFAQYVGAKYAIAVNSGTSALHTGLMCLGIDEKCEVITQSLSFIATSNSISYCGASPIFLDVERESIGLSPEALLAFLETETIFKENVTINKRTGKKIGAILPVHVLGHACRIDEIVEIANRYNIPVIEDAAESLGSSRNGQHTGTFGHFGAFSFNGNKVATAGGGGMLVTNSKKLFEKAKLLSNVAKISKSQSYDYSSVGYNYRMPNLNASLVLAQLENIDSLLKRKKQIINSYKQIELPGNFQWVTESQNCSSNYWLNALILPDKISCDFLINFLSKKSIDVRPLWPLIHQTKPYIDCQCQSMTNSEWFYDRVITLPS